LKKPVETENADTFVYSLYLSPVCRKNGTLTSTSIL